MDLPDTAELILSLTKVLSDPSNTGINLSAGDYRFIVSDEDGEEIATATNNSSGSVSFTLAFYYDGTLTYDNTSYPITITVEYEDGSFVISSVK